MLAETVNEARNDLLASVTLQDGIDAINRVRDRAGLLPLDASVTGDQNSFRDAIRKERKLELCFKGWRKYDLIRWNVSLRPRTCFPAQVEPLSFAAKTTCKKKPGLES